MDPDLDAFLAKVAKVHETVTGIVDGSIPVESVSDADVQSKQTATSSSTDPSKRSGDGTGDGYAFICVPCRMEYMADRKQCDLCGKAVLSRSDRLADLQNKVQTLMTQKAVRQRRRELFLQRKQQHADATLRVEAWDLFEPESDDEDLPVSDNPAMMALAADVDARNAVRAQREAQAAEAKQSGNVALAKKDLPLALQQYSKAIELRRDEKSYYTNRALVYLQLQDYANAIKDCDTAIDIFHYFEDHSRSNVNTVNRRHVSDPVLIKAYLRKASALRGVNRLADAIATLKDAQRTTGAEDEDCRKLLAQLQLEQVEQQKQQRVSMQVSAVSGTCSVPSSSSSSARAIDTNSSVVMNDTLEVGAPLVNALASLLTSAISGPVDAAAMAELAERSTSLLQRADDLRVYFREKIPMSHCVHVLEQHAFDANHPAAHSGMYSL